MLTIQSRRVFLAMFLATTGLIVFALYLQYFHNIVPCPLCMLQRVVFIAIAFVCLLAAIHNPRLKGLRAYGVTSFLLCLLGLALASRHLWLESLPPGQAPACGPSLEIMLQYLPLFDALKSAIMGSGECAKVSWQLFQISIAAWSFISFAGLLVLSLNIIIKPVGRL